MALSKEDYLKGLAAVEASDSEASPDKPEPQKDKPTEEAPPSAGLSVSEDKKQEDPPKQDEPFAGWNLLPEETRKSLQEKLEAAAKVTQLQEDLQKREREFSNSQSRLAPTQQQLAKLQADHAKLQKQIKEYENRHQDSISAEAKKKLEAWKQQFPDESDVVETLTNQAYRVAEAANRRTEALEKKLAEQERLAQFNSELSNLAKVHPDWKEARFSQEFDTWRNSLDPYTKEMMETAMRSPRANDNIFVLNQFKHDLAWARSMQTQNGQQSQQVEAAPSAKAPTPVLDPDPSRRQTAPSKTAGQPMSEKKRAFIEAAKFFENQRTAR